MRLLLISMMHLNGKQRMPEEGSLSLGVTTVVGTVVVLDVCTWLAMTVCVDGFVTRCKTTEGRTDAVASPRQAEWIVSIVDVD
jgi:hypothetical protein